MAVGLYTKKVICYVIPFYYDAGNVHPLFNTLTKTISADKYKSKYDFTFIFVNDGSTDATLKELIEVQQKDKRVTVINLARNYGHQIAVTAGLDHADADAVIIMDSDLQDPPRVSLELIDKWEEGYDVVYAQRRSRKDSAFKKLTANVYYRLLQKLTDIDIPRDTGDFRLIDKKVIAELGKFKEHNRFLRGMVSYIGFRQTPVLFDRDPRFAGKSGYSLKKLIKLAKDGIFGFSSAPLKFISRLGYTIALLSVVGIIYALFYKLFYPGAVVEGWTFTVISIFLIGGIQLVMLGVLGSYIGRIYTEVQDRPLYSIDEIHSGRKPRA